MIDPAALADLQRMPTSTLRALQRVSREAREALVIRCCTGGVREQGEAAVALRARGQRRRAR